MKQTHPGKVIDTQDGKKVVLCRACGFTHVTPLPSESEQKQFYEEEFYQHEKPNYFKETKEDLSWWMATYGFYYQLLERYTKGRKLLDVGSGPGHFLAAGKKRGWHVLGVEPSPMAAAYSNHRGLKTVTDFFTKQSAKTLGTFDVVHAALVLEHVPDPAAFIADMSMGVRKGGLIAIFCPNDYNPLQQAVRTKFGLKPWWVVPRHHVNYFTPESMSGLLTQSGFEVLDTLGTYPLETFLLSGKMYVGNSKVGRACHASRKVFELYMYKKQPELLEDLYRGLIVGGVGREFLIIARKR